MIILIGGGSRSGKSRYALKLALEFSAPRVFIATAETRDDEMRARAQAHRSERGGNFTTVEEPLELGQAILRASHENGVVVVDCLTLWVSNLLFADPARDIAAETSQMLFAAGRAEDAKIILVTNEVGCGIVPDNELSRRFRDLAGSVNQQAAAAAAEVYWMAFGCPIRVK
ncbi:MAG TPA: bifunctional adenosylcobinamide kinase/adenosylcobinamide-phosphate guanylyltransferase [Bryobacteraceae bacterium]|nr:bifunctional adenosylcobinamide kinase/adenosylcobinamide-phosphate guanylyltransferase [Bryobacteraceae bacterium]